MNLDILSQCLRLRPFTLDDAPLAARYAGDYDVARMTTSVPHPYPVETAEGWIMTHPHGRRRGVDYPFAVTRRIDNALVGAAGVFKRRGSDDFELGYWIAKPHWGLGYATEAALALARWSRDELGCDRLTAGYFTDNPASSRVLEKAGFVPTGKVTKLYSLARNAQVDSADMVADLAALPADASDAQTADA